jgi:murein DD-endopeptidase MepM/ murein hydrolase activator NlpD
LNLNLQQRAKSWIEKKFLFVIRRKEDFSVITSFSITKVRVGLLLILLLMICFGISLILAKTVLSQWFDPAYTESENTARLYALSETVDSLLMEVEAKDTYVQNIQRIIEGNEVTDTVNKVDPALPLKVDRQEIDLYKTSEATKSIIEEFESKPLDENSFTGITSTSFSDAYFFPPIKGVVTGGFEPSKSHFGVDIVSAENEPVKSIADGTVVFASWTLETGYVVTVQHSNELISIYKHNSVLLKNLGDPVRGGEIISIIGNTGEQTTGQHLHIELWYKGNPLNPQEFITFD